MSDNGVGPTRLELRAEVIRAVTVRGERRRGCLDHLEVGWEDSVDRVDGAEAIQSGSVREDIGGLRTVSAADASLWVAGKLSLHVHGQTTLMGGAMLEKFEGATYLGAGMADDMAMGGGVRGTAPTDIWLVGLIGMEEKIGTACGDAMCVDMGTLVLEREYGPGVHSFGTAVFNGAQYRTTASGFRQLYRTWKGVRNMAPGGGGDAAAAEGPPPGAPVPPPVAGGAESGAMLAGGTARAGSRLGNVSAMDDAVRAADAAEDAATVGEDAVQLGEDAARPTLSDLLEESRRLSEADADVEGNGALPALLRAVTGEADPVSPGAVEDATGEVAALEDVRRFDDPDWTAVPAGGPDAAPPPPPPPPPPSIDDLPRDDFDDAWAGLHRRYEVGLDDEAHGTYHKEIHPDNWVRLPGGRQQAALDHLRDTENELRLLMAHLVEPHLADPGLDLEEFHRLRDAQRGSGMELRKYYLLAIESAENAGDADQAAAMRQALADYDTLAQQRIADALGEADRLRDLDLGKRSPTLDVEAFREEIYQTAFFDWLMNPETGIAIDEKVPSVQLFGYAGSKAGMGYDPVPFVLDARLFHMSRSTSPPEYFDEAAQEIIRILAKHDPSLAAPPDDAANPRDWLVWNRNQAILAGDFADAAEQQRRLDMFDTDPQGYAAWLDRRAGFVQALDTPGRRPPDGPATEPDAFDDTFSTLLRRREQADDQHQRTATTGANPNGLHQAGHRHTMETVKRLDDLMIQTMTPYLDELGATAEDLEALRTPARARGADVDAPMVLRQWFRQAIDNAERSGDTARAEAMRQALANYDAVASRMIGNAVAQADWYSSFPGVALAPDVDAAGTANGINERAFEMIQQGIMGTAADGSQLDEVQRTAKSEVGNVLVLMSQYAESGQDPMPYLLAARRSAVEQGADAEVLREYDDALVWLRGFMFEQDPSIGTAGRPAGFDIDELGDIESMRWWQRQLFYAGDFDGAMDLQRRMDELQGRALPFSLPLPDPSLLPPPPPGGGLADATPGPGAWSSTDLSALDTSVPPRSAGVLGEAPAEPPAALLDELAPASGAPRSADPVPAALNPAEDLAPVLENPRPGQIDIETAPSDAGDADDVLAFEPDIVIDFHFEEEDTPPVVGWVPPPPDGDPPMPALGDAGANWSDPLEAQLREFGGELDWFDDAPPPPPPGPPPPPPPPPPREPPQVPLRPKPPNPLDNVTVPRYEGPLSLPADYPVDRMSGLLDRQIQALRPDNDLYDPDVLMRSALQRMRDRMNTGLNPLAFLDLEIKRIQVRRLEYHDTGMADELAALEQVRAAYATSFGNPPAPNPAALDVPRVPVPERGSPERRAITRQLTAEVKAFEQRTLHAAEAEFRAIPTPPDIDGSISLDRQARQIAAREAWETAYGADYVAAQERLENITLAQSHREDILRQAQDDLFKDGLNPLARIEQEKAEIRAMLAINADSALKRRLQALEDVGGWFEDLVPALPADAIGPESDLRRYDMALRAGEFAPRPVDVPDEESFYSFISPLDRDVPEPDGFDDLWSSTARRDEQAQADLALANPAVEEGDPPPPVGAAGLHSEATEHLQATRQQLDKVMRQMLEGSGLSDQELADIDRARLLEAVNRGSRPAPEGPMQLRQYYLMAIEHAASEDPVRAADMRAALANFDAMARRELTEALEYADWLSAFPGVPLSPATDPDALKADLHNEFMRLSEFFKNGIPSDQEEIRKVSNRMSALQVAQYKVSAGLDPVAGMLEFQRTQIIEGTAEPEDFDGLLDLVLDMMAKGDPDFRKPPSDPTDRRAELTWLRNEQLYAGNLPEALQGQHQLDLLDAATDSTPVPSRLDDLFDAEGVEARTLLASADVPEDEVVRSKPLPLPEDDWRAVRDGLPEGSEVALASPETVPPPPPPTPETPEPMPYAWGQGPPPVDPDADEGLRIDEVAGRLLGLDADSGSASLPADDALTPVGEIPRSDSLFTVVPPPPPPEDADVLEDLQEATYVNLAVEPAAGRGEVDLSELTPVVSQPDVALVGTGPEEAITSYMTVDIAGVWARDPWGLMDAWSDWFRDTQRAEGPFDLAGVDESALEMFQQWRALPSVNRAPPDTDANALVDSLRSGLGRYVDVRRPPPEYSRDADPTALAAYMALRRTDADLRDVARGFEGKLREVAPDFDFLRDLDDITAVRAALLNAADNTDDLDESITLRQLVQSIDDRIYRSVTDALAEADGKAAADPTALPDRLYADYARRELAGRVAQVDAQDPYGAALARALGDLDEGLDPRDRLDARILFLEAQIADSGGNAARRRALQTELDGVILARATVSDAVVKWTRPAPLGGAALTGFDFDESWTLLHAGADGEPAPATYVPDDVMEDLRSLSRDYAARLPEGRLADLDTADLAAVRAQIVDLHEQALDALKNPSGELADLSPLEANRYETMLASLDARTHRILDQEGLANTLDETAARARYPGLSSALDEWAEATGLPGDPAALGLDADQADAFADWYRQLPGNLRIYQGQGPLDLARQQPFARFVRFLRHQRRRIIGRAVEWA